SPSRAYMGSWIVPLATLLVVGAKEIRVVGADGKPATGVDVVAQVGLDRLALAQGFERWCGVKRIEATTDEHGTCVLDGLPEGAHLTVFARRDGETGLVEGDLDAELVLALRPTGGLSGKASGKKSLRGYTLQ